MSKMFNRARMTITSTGTGALTLGVAVTGYQTFSSAGVSNGDTVSYTIEDGVNWECGTGVFTLSGTTLSRTVTQSYNGSTYGTSPISVTTSAQVFITALAADLQSGTAAGNLVALDGSAKLPAVDGSQLTNVPVTATNFTGTLPVSKGGTGLTSLTAGYIPYGNGTSAFSSSSALQFDGSRLGIGTANSFDTSPAGTGQYPLFGTWSLSTNLIQSAIGMFSDAANSATAIFLKSRGTSLGANVAVVNGDGIGTLTFRGADGTNYRNVASIAVSVDGPVSTGIVSGRIVFNTADTSGTNTERMRLDASGNLGLGATPSAWSSSYKAITIGYSDIASTGSGAIPLSLTQNAYYNSSGNWVTKITSTSKRYEINDYGFIWYNGASATAGNPITFTQAMTLDASSNLSVAGNFVMGTADKGIDFSINSSAAGMTSELLNDYETGTWTPTYVSATGAFGTITYNSITYGRYTKIGNTVVVLGIVATDAVNAGTAAGLVYIAGLPFTPATSASSAINYSSAFNTNNPSGGYTSSTRIYPTYRSTANGSSTGIQAGDIDTVSGAYKNYVIFQATYVV